VSSFAAGKWNWRRENRHDLNGILEIDVQGDWEGSDLDAVCNNEVTVDIFIP
jgi:hypothetical protein